LSIFKLPDGRDFEYITNDSVSKSAGKAKSGQAILMQHGTPGSCMYWKEWFVGSFAQNLDVQLIATSRAGYGKSARHLGRKVADDLIDQAALLDFLNVKSFVAIGHSGGGPHAINMTRDSRCKGVITLAGVGEFGNSDLDFLAGMGPENEDEFGEAIKGEAAITSWMNKNAVGFQKITGAEIIAAFGGLIGDADKAVLTAEFAEEIAYGMRYGIENNFAGWIDDDLAFVQRFGFSLSQINKPVLLWQGDDDFMVPKAHGEWLAKKIPGAKLNFVAGHGHLSLIKAYRKEILEAALTLLN
jgi:pimeloyl-ACP methyl ester carboxylesterase